MAGGPTRIADGQGAGDQPGQRPGESQSPDAFLKRFVGFAEKYGLESIGYYPPYHSQYNPIERCWGILEMHWNGSLLDSVKVVVGFAESMTWKGKHPVVHVVETTTPRE